MKYNVYETLIGLLIMIFFVVCSLFAYKASCSVTGKGYIVTARFQNAEGLSVGSKVKVSGVRVGEIKDVSLDQDLSVIVKMKLDQGVPIPKDATAAVISESLMGPKIVVLQPGCADENLKNGDEISYTEASLSLEEIVKKLIYKFNK